jgi:ATP phosphoribosyltransferase
MAQDRNHPKVEIDGNDGTGKSTLVELLSSYGIHAKDRGTLTKASDDNAVQPEADVCYILLDIPVDVCRERLEKAGKDLNERYHTEDDLIFYRDRFLEEAHRFKAHIITAASKRATLQAAIAAVTGRALHLGLPKGRLQQGVVTLMRAAGFYLQPEARKLSTLDHGVDAVLLKPRAIPQLVALGFLDVGFCGRDILQDSIYDDLHVLCDTGLNPVRLLAAATRADLLDAPPARPLVVATEFNHLADRWLTEKNLAHIILHAHGSTEAYAPRFADLVIDVVETGATLAQNQLTPVHEFGHSSTVFFCHKDQKDRPDIRALCDTIVQTKEAL